MGLATGRALQRRGHDVVVYEQFQPGHDRGSSHGRSRIFRLAYAEQEYVRLAQEALGLWRELEAETGTTLLELNGLLEIVRTLDERPAASSGIASRARRPSVGIRSASPSNPLPWCSRKPGSSGQTERSRLSAASLTSATGPASTRTSSTPMWSSSLRAPG